VNLWLWIEGEAAPAENFATLTEEAVRGIIAAGSEQYPGLAVTVQKIEEDRSEEDEEESG
jgi:hypothetical protein